ncbi:hypothetical protein K504DRAFT_451805 [Pleomassaria siparia CBS 279.74]|uniref:Uncharacterized protein n=1 Tax=Pleomassaria siparia CBS 279.74 TaxID=1314801 RepID=A0A6G1JRQ1_9PLEO|nr:hypothetical protein K504DRAFT_451805 [Pleomassaria siparia CBS 279.74]
MHSNRLISANSTCVYNRRVGGGGGRVKRGIRRSFATSVPKVCPQRAHTVPKVAEVSEVPGADTILTQVRPISAFTTKGALRSKGKAGRASVVPMAPKAAQRCLEGGIWCPGGARAAIGANGANGRLILKPPGNPGAQRDNVAQGRQCATIGVIGANGGTGTFEKIPDGADALAAGADALAAGAVIDALAARADALAAGAVIDALAAGADALAAGAARALDSLTSKLGNMRFICAFKPLVEMCVVRVLESFFNNNYGVISKYYFRTA